MNGKLNVEENKNKILLAVCVAVPLIVGGLSSFLSGGGMRVFGGLRQPPLSPPGWLFPVVWTILYIMMGVASYLVITSGASMQYIAKAISLYGYQLLANFLWPIFFFDFGWYFFSFIWLILLWMLVFKTAKEFVNISRTAALLLLPYLVWVAFAGYLNLGIWWLNR